MAKFHATRVQIVADGVNEHQLLRFDDQKARDRYIEAVGAQVISARDVAKLMIADVWRTYSSAEAGCVFHAARYVPQTN